MFVRVKSTPNSPRKSVQICEAVRRGDKVSQTIVRHVGVAETEAELEKLKDLAEVIKERLKEERSQNLPLFAPEALVSKSTRRKERAKLLVNLARLREEQRVIEGISDVLGALYEQLGFDEVFDRTPLGRSRAYTLKVCVLARLAKPSSKLRTAALLEDDYGVKLPVGRIYRMLDRLAGRTERVQEIAKEAALAVLKKKVDILLYDVTTLYFESQREDELRRFGYGKDGKVNEVQVVLALATTEEGLPLGYHLFHGATWEGHTLRETLKSFAGRYQIKRIICVADRAMLSEENLKWIEAQGWQYVVSMRLRSLSQEWKEKILAEFPPAQPISEQPVVVVREWQYGPARRLVVSYSSERHRKDAFDRERLLQKVNKLLSGKTEASPEKLISNRGVRRFLRSAEQGKVVLDQTKIEQDKYWDGLYGVISNCSLPKEDLLTLYKGLWQIESAFRLNKHDLKIRPVFHWTPARIEAHVAICFIAYAVAKHAEYRVGLQYEKLSFEFIRNELLAVQASILVDTATKKRYLLPSNMSVAAKKLYQCFGLRRSCVPCLMPK